MASITAVKLAMVLAALGVRIGVLDAGIYSLSVRGMLGLSGRH